MLLTSIFDTISFIASEESILLSHMGKKILRKFLCKTFFYSISILNWFQTWTGPAQTGPAKTLAWHIWSRFSEAYFSVPVEDTSFGS